MDGRDRTDATFLQPPTKPATIKARRSWWHWRPGWHRAAIRLGTVAFIATVANGLFVNLVATVASLAAAATILLSWCAWRLARGAVRWGRAARWDWDSDHPWKSTGHATVIPWVHYWHYVRPLRYALTEELGVPPARIRVPLDRSSAVIGMPLEYTGSDKKSEAVTRAVAVKLALETPDVTAKLAGRRPRVFYTRAVPPPAYVAWDDMAGAVAAAAGNELIFGPGVRDTIVKASYGESPHVAIPGGSGGGKSNLAAVLLLQELMRGSLIFNLDPKWISHLWLQDLPNVINAHETEHLHTALCWLGGELLRRTKAVYYSAAGTGRPRAKPGRRIIVLAEELNYGMPGLKEYHRETRGKDGPKQSPAVAGLSALSCAGRASDMHEYLIAQLLTVDSTGVRDSTIRTNAGIKAMVRWDKPGWEMAIGKHIAMPPPTTTPGRIQLVTGDTPRQAQIPYLHLDDDDTAVADRAVAWARELAVSGDVAEIPHDLPRQLWPPSVLRQAGLSIDAGQEPETAETVLDAARTITIRDAWEEGMFGDLTLWAARKRIQRAGLRPHGDRGDEYPYVAVLAAASNDKKELVLQGE